MSVLAAILGLLVLIFVHELGHFAAAKLTGMRAIRFSIGFPPFLARRQVGDTEYAIGAIPLGGYVKIPGMLRPDEGDLWEVGDVLERNESLPPDQATEIAALYEQVRSDLARGRYDQIRPMLDRLEAALAAAEAHLSDTDRRKVARALNRVREATDPRAYWRCSRARRLIVILAGPMMNVFAAFLIFMFVAATGKPQPAEPINVAAAIVRDSPAATAGLTAGDRIVAVDGRRVQTFEQLRAAIAASNGRPIVVTVRRDGRTLQLDRVAPQRAADGRWVLGFQPDAEYRTKSYSLPDAAVQAVDDMWALTSGTFTALSQIGTSQGRDQVSSVVGIVRYTADASSIGLNYYLTLIAAISLSLAIFNLLPFLPLDGGHVLMIAVEKLRGRALSRTTFERASAVGIALMLLLFMIGLQNDLGNLFGPQ